MSGGKLFALIALGGVGLYLLWRTTRGSQGELGDALSIFDPLFGSPSTVAGIGTNGPGNVPGSRPTAPSSLPTTAIGAGAGIGSTIAGAGSIGAGAAIAITAGAAGAALLAWGIIAKGWFRGGEEALQVNPARDDFVATFVPVHQAVFGRIYPPQTYDTSVRDGDWKYLYGEVLAHFDPNIGPQLTSALQAADTKAEFDSAVKNIQSFVAFHLQRAA